MAERDGVLLLIVLITAAFAESTSTAVTYVIYDRARTWNDAYQTCRENGGDLLHIKDDVTMAVLKYFIAQPEWQTGMTGNFWIGLRRSEEGVYKWTDCNALSSWTLWYPGEDSRDIPTTTCVYSSPDNLQWYTSTCQAGHRQFVCQIPAGVCTYSVSSATCSGTVSSRSESVADEFLCKELCESSVDDTGRQCWAYQYSSTSCRLLYTTDPFFCDRDAAGDAQMSSKLFQIRRCFSLTVNNSDWESKQDTLPGCFSGPSSQSLENSNLNLPNPTEDHVTVQLASSPEFRISSSKMLTEYLHTSTKLPFHVSTTGRPHVIRLSTALSVSATEDTFWFTSIAEQHDTSYVQLTTWHASRGSRFLQPSSSSDNEHDSSSTSSYVLIYEQTSTETGHRPLRSAICSCAVCKGYNSNYTTLLNTVLNKNSVSSFRRKLSSIDDNRTSARMIGTVGVVVIVMSALSIMLSDVVAFVLQQTRTPNR